MMMLKLNPFILLVLTTALLAQTPTLSKDTQSFVAYSQPLIALTHVRVIDGTGAPARDDQTVLISNGLIAAIASNLPIPPNATTIDASGDTVMPGIVGMHDHMYYPAPRVNPAQHDALYPEHASSFPKLYLAGGVTTIRTTGSVEPYTDLEIKKAIDAGKTPGPKMHITGPYLEGAGSYTVDMHELKDADDATTTVNYWIYEGATSFKAYMHITRAELKAAVDAAHAHHLKITGHLCSIGFHEAAALGIDDLEHGLFVDTEFDPAKQPDVCPTTSDENSPLLKLDVNGPQLQGLIKDLVSKHVAITSTLPVFEISVPGRAPTDARVLAAMLPEARASYLARRDKVAATPNSPWPALFKLELAFEREFVRQGGTLLAGLDPTGYGGVVPGYGDQREIELLVEAGFTPLEAIHIATFNGAQFLEESAHIGSLAPQKSADLVLIKGDPSKNIKDIENVQLVFKDGIAYDPAKLTDAANGTVGLR